MPFLFSCMVKCPFLCFLPSVLPSSQWEDMTVLDSAQLEGYRSMNPCPIYDRFTGAVFLFFIAVLGDTSESLQLITGKNVTRLCYVSSQDRGKTWSPVMDMTLAVIGDAIKGTVYMHVCARPPPCVMQTRYYMLLTHFSERKACGSWTETVNKLC